MLPSDHRNRFGPGEDATVVRPRPGFRPPRPETNSGDPFPDRRGPRPEAPFGPASSASERTAAAASGVRDWNPLLEAALPSLLRANAVRHAADGGDILALREQFVNDLMTFDQRAREVGDVEMLADARYVLCTFIDETVLKTPWGSHSRWQEESLLSAFFNETWGGDRFFALLERDKRQPGRALYLLELLFVCLVLGFEGKYHVLERGRARLDELIDDLFRLLRDRRGDVDPQLSPRWRGIDTTGHPVTRMLPLWALAAIAGALLISLYLTFWLALGNAAAPVFERLSRIEDQPLPIIAATLPESQQNGNRDDRNTKGGNPPPPPPDANGKQPTHARLQEMLAPEIARGMLSIEHDALKTAVKIKSDALFASGSATVNASFIPVLERVGQAIDQVEGRVKVFGYTDNVPIRTLKFPSNWELSRARASNVARLLESQLREPARVDAEGRADAEPVAANTTPAGRALNRRVEIWVYERQAP